MEYLVILPHQKDVSVIHKCFRYLIFDVDFGWGKFIGYNFLGTELRDEGRAILCDDNDHIICGGDIDYLLEMTQMVNCALVITVDGLRGEDDDVVIACYTFGKGFIDGQFLREGVSLLMVLLEQVIVISYVLLCLLPQTYILIVKFKIYNSSLIINSSMTSLAS